MSESSSPQAAPFGAVLGTSTGGVTAHSSDYESADPVDHPDHDAYRHFIDGEYMGYKWQCVEFARRWLYLNQGVVFDDVPMAHDIFRLRTLRRVADSVTLPLHAFHNGSTRHPQPGCLLIWNAGGEFHVTGHVAIVIEVLRDRVRIAEQNVDHTPWPAGQAWSRELPARIDAEGGFWIQATLPGASILGWMLQTDDARHAVPLDEVDAALFDIGVAEVARRGQHEAAWLDPAREADAAFVAAMGGHRLTVEVDDQYRYFRLSETALDELRRATDELHAMFMHATQVVLNDDKLLALFNIPEVLWPRLRVSWERRRGQMITGRFDFSVSHRGVKVYEYNADSASCHMETGRVQGRWAAHFGCPEGRDPGDDLFDSLVAAWRDAGVDDVLHIMYDADMEEAYHARFIRSAAEVAGIECRMIRGVTGLGWNAAGEVIDPHGHPIRWVWKTWSWETALDQLRDECIEDDRVPIALGPEGARRAPRLADVLLRRDVVVFEPLWTLIPSNKAILPILWSIFPNHPYLLDSRFEPAPDFGEGGYVVKPIVGRCGANISIYSADDTLLTETDGKFDDRAQIYQAYFGLPNIEGLNVQVCTFSVDGMYGGACVRVDPSLVITTESDLLPLRVVPDRSL